eukprot:6191421-Pleurochrysis_carterae.AAC.5
MGPCCKYGRHAKYAAAEPRSRNETAALYPHKKNYYRIMADSTKVAVPRLPNEEAEYVAVVTPSALQIPKFRDTRMHATLRIPMIGAARRDDSRAHSTAQHTRGAGPPPRWATPPRCSACPSPQFRRAL